MNDTLRIDAEARDPRPEASTEEAHRVRLGVNAATPADVLTKLAADPSVRVRGVGNQSRRAGGNVWAAGA